MVLGTGAVIRVAMRAALVAGAIGAGAVIWASSAGPARAEDGALTVAASPELIESGLLKWLAPRFRFKSRISLDVVPLEGAEGEAAVLLFDEADAVLEKRTPVASRGETRYAASVTGADEVEAKKFVSWLISQAGLRAITRFEPETGAAFAPPGAVKVDRVVASSAGTDRGEKLALQHCGRCHVISEKNKYGGIGSTPSFPALRAIPKWKEKFAAFWTLNPHPSFTQIDGVTPPFPAERPPHIAPVELTLEDAEAIAAYAASIPPKDLGGEVKAQ